MIDTFLNCLPKGDSLALYRLGRFLSIIYMSDT